jgi:hypothetical protein
MMIKTEWFWTIKSELVVASEQLLATWLKNQEAGRWANCWTWVLHRVLCEGMLIKNFQLDVQNPVYIIF